MARRHRTGIAARTFLRIWQNLGIGIVICAGCCLAPIARSQPTEQGFTDAARFGVLLQSTEAYLNLITSLGDGQPWSDSAAVHRHLAQLALVLPGEVMREVAVGDLRHAPEKAQILPGAGARLRNWWRRQDPLPASPLNERLVEHVQRVLHAEAHLGSGMRPTRLDDRGEIYVMYGRPERELVVRFDDPEFTDQIYQFGLAINQSDFPDNVFWRYGHIDGSGHYLFLLKDGQYRIGQTTDLLPRMLRSGFSPDPRGRRRAQMALATMRTIYRQLAAEDPVFLERYSAVDSYLAAQEAPGRVASRVLGEAFRRTVLDQDDYTELQPGGNERPPSEVIQSTITSSRVKDAQLAYQRSVLMPPDYSEVHRMVRNLPMGLRTARFLDRDGTTRTELYWGPEPGALRSTALEEDYALHLTAVQMGPDYVRRAVSVSSIRIQDLPRGRDAVIPAQQAIVRGDTGLYHLAVQWDLYRLTARRVRGERIAAGARHVDSLSALDAAGTALEMSDLKPVMMWSAVELVGESVPYPFMQVASDMPLGLYFELYHLTYDRDDYTRYSVTYRIAGQGPDGAGRSPTSVTASYTGTAMRDQQEVLLDLTEWAGPVTVTVAARDLTTGHTARRSIDFELY